MSNFINTSETMGSEAAVLDALIAHDILDFKDDTIVKLGQYAFYKNNGLQSVELPNVTEVESDAFTGCTAMTSATFARLQTFGKRMFSECTALTTITAQGLTSVSQYAFDGCSNLTTIDLTNVTNVGDHAFKNCAKLGVIALPACTSIGNNLGYATGPTGFDFTQKITVIVAAFNASKNMQHLVLRSSQVCPLVNVNALTGTPIAVGCGYIYVPADLVDTYKTASNWSIYASQIQPITAYPKAATGSISDTWEQVFEAEQNGTYSSKYSIGDTKVVDIDGTSVLMQIVAMDTDVLANDNTQTAPITWISAGILETRAMNTTNTASGGWADSALRAYMRETLFPKIESTVRSNIKEVSKTYRSETSADSTLTVSDTVWIPSLRDIFGETSYGEENGVDYTTIFNSPSARIKKTGSFGLNTATAWWVRSAASGTKFRCVDNTGYINSGSASNVQGLVLGFCT